MGRTALQCRRDPARILPPSRRDQAMEQFTFILSRPDNIPITILLISVVICLYVALKQAFKNDRLIEEGREDEIYEDMIK